MKTVLHGLCTLALLLFPLSASQALKKVPNGGFCLKGDPRFRCFSGKCNVLIGGQPKHKNGYCVAKKLFCAWKGSPGKGQGTKVRQHGKRWICSRWRSRGVWFTDVGEACKRQRGYDRFRYPTGCGTNTLCGLAANGKAYCRKRGTYCAKKGTAGVKKGYRQTIGSVSLICYAGDRWGSLDGGVCRKHSDCISKKCLPYPWSGKSCAAKTATCAWRGTKGYKVNTIRRLRRYGKIVYVKCLSSGKWKTVYPSRSTRRR